MPSAALRDELELYEHVDPEALNMLFKADSEVELSVQFRLPCATVSVWNDGGNAIRVTEPLKGRRGAEEE